MAARHRTAVIDQVTNALRKTFDSDYPDDMFKVVYTGPNFQMEQQSYPAIYVAYQESSIKNIGLGHRVAAVDTQGFDRLLRQSIAEGSIQLTVMALTPLERDVMLDNLMDAIMFGKDSPTKNAFWNEIFDEDFIWLNLNTENLMPGSVSPVQAPWGQEDAMLHTGSYMLTSTCEFYSDYETSDFVPINQVRILPYREDQQVPLGADDPAEWN